MKPLCWQLLVAAWPLLLACGGQRADVGADAQLLVAGGTFVREALPAGGRGPAVQAAFLGNSAFPVGQQRKSFSGVLDHDATALAINLEGDNGYWLVAAGAPLVETPTLPSFEAPLSFSRTAKAGPHALVLSAADGAGHFGPHKNVAFSLTTAPVSDARLVFSLYWDRPADLDLHVTLPDGTEIYKDDMSAWEPTGTDADALGFANAGHLDLDSNAQCRIDGRNNENVLWAGEPPPGRYVVRVETFSLCGESSARFSLEARYRGERFQLVEGQSTATDTRGVHGLGAGLTLLELQVD